MEGVAVSGWYSKHDSFPLSTFSEPRTLCGIDISLTLAENSVLSFKCLLTHE